MNRRELLKWIGVSAPAAMLAQLAPTAYASQPAATPLVAGDAAAAKPNVLMIIVDDLNDWVGCLGGHPQARTPNIDRLAARGMLFTNAHCVSPLCNPSRAAMLTGKLPVSTGVYTNNENLRALQPNAVTLPQYFKTQGYRTIGAGKVFHLWQDLQSWTTYHARPATPLPAARPLNNIPGYLLFDWGPLNVSDQQMGDYWVADWAGRQLQFANSQPFFMAVGLLRPHLPMYAPRKYFDLFPSTSVTLPQVQANDLADVPPTGIRLASSMNRHATITKYGKWNEGVAAYLACVAYTDAMIGRLLDALERSPYANNTVVVLVGDNGWHLGEKQHWEKWTLWEEATRVPMIISAPGMTTKGQRCAQPVSLLDIYPTLVQMCGLPAKPDLEGISVAPQLANPLAVRARPAITLLGPANCAVRDQDWRYIRYGDGSEELYNHTVDPNEWTNLAGNATYAQVKAGLKQWVPSQVLAAAPAADQAIEFPGDEIEDAEYTSEAQPRVSEFGDPNIFLPTVLR